MYYYGTEAPDFYENIDKYVDITFYEASEFYDANGT
jgi:hypothetical protein